MESLIKPVEKKVNSFVWSFVGSGVVLVMLGILILWNSFVLRLLIGLFVFVVAYSFFYGAYKIYSIKKEVKKYFNF